MKAITIRQPWASLIMIGAKPYEYRSWRTHLRGRIAIHAAAGMGPRERAELRDPKTRKVLAAAGLDPYNLPKACVLGTVELYDCKEHSRIDFSWALRTPRPFAKPEPAKGKLSFWEWNGLDVAPPTAKPLPPGTYYPMDHIAPAGAWVLEGIRTDSHSDLITWKRFFRSLASLQAIAGKVDNGWTLNAYRVIGSGADSYTEEVRL